MIRAIGIGLVFLAGLVVGSTFRAEDASATESINYVSGYVFPVSVGSCSFAADSGVTNYLGDFLTADSGYEHCACWAAERDGGTP